MEGTSNFPHQSLVANAGTRSYPSGESPTLGSGSILDNEPSGRQPPGRRNPFGEAPSRLLEAVDGQWLTRLEHVIELIDGLPSEFRAAMGDYMNIALIDDLRRITRAMRKLRENMRPYKEELLTLWLGLPRH